MVLMQGPQPSPGLAFDLWVYNNNFKVVETNADYIAEFKELTSLFTWFNEAKIPYVAALGMAHDLELATRYALLAKVGIVVPPRDFSGIRLTTVPLCTSAFLQFMCFLRNPTDPPAVAQQKSYRAVLLSEITHLQCDVDTGCAVLKFSHVKVIDYQPRPWFKLDNQEMRYFTRIHWRLESSFIQMKAIMKQDKDGMNFTSEWDFNDTDKMVGGGSAATRRKKPVPRPLPAPRRRW